MPTPTSTTVISGRGAGRDGQAEGGGAEVDQPAGRAADQHDREQRDHRGQDTAEEQQR